MRYIEILAPDNDYSRFNVRVSEFEFINIVFEQFLYKSEQLYYETKEELTFEKAIRLINNFAPSYRVVILEG